MRLALAVQVVLALTATTAAAQPTSGERVRLEIWGGVVATAPASGGSIASDYAPLMVSSPDYSSHAKQTLAVDAGWGRGFDVGANFFASRWFGIQSALVYSRAAISGAGNSDYTVDLRYVSRQPPDYTPHEYTTSSALAWPDTEGTMSCRSLSLGGVFRVGGASRRLGGSIAGGVSVSRITTDVRSVAYTVFRLGGHSTLFQTQHRVAISTADADALVRPYIGGDLSIRMNAHVAAFGGIRAEFGSPSNVEARPDSLVDPDEDAFAPEMSEVQHVLTLGPMRTPSARWHIIAGIKFLVK
jgi:hypothetical protein